MTRYQLSGSTKEKRQNLIGTGFLKGEYREMTALATPLLSGAGNWDKPKAEERLHEGRGRVSRDQVDQERF